MVGEREKKEEEKGEGGEMIMYGRSFEDQDGNIWEVVRMSEGFLAGEGDGVVGVGKEEEEEKAK